MAITDLEPKVIWQHFEAINAIPRASTKEEEIIEFMIAFGKSLDLETSVDAIGNVIIKKPATKRKENCRTVVLQGHLDMVHQKEATSNFDFVTQGIQMFIDRDWVKAKETTLGADNGIGVAAIMAILSSSGLEHPPIEALFTVDEEKGMTGAMGLTENQLQGEILLNLDSEEDDEITIGCAGGVDVEIDGSFDTKILDGTEFKLYEISVGGLTGGHSGVDIHLNRANAILVLVECLNELITKLDARLHSVDVGTLTNVIPRNGTAVIAIREDNLFTLASELETLQSKLKKKYLSTDPHLNITSTPIGNSTGVLDVGTQNALLTGLLQIPNGVYSMTEGIEGLVQTSNNIAIANIGEGKYHLACHTRSSVDIERNELANKIKSCFPFANVSEIGPYPGWEPRPDSELLALATNCYKEINGKLPAIKSIHAGLECGILSGIFPQMQMISFGPNILGAHSPEERLQVSSVQKFWKFLTTLLRKLN
jgi:dipeptidase D